MSIVGPFPDFARRAVDTAASTAALIASEMSAEDPENAKSFLGELKSGDAFSDITIICKCTILPIQRYKRIIWIDLQQGLLQWRLKVLYLGYLYI